MDTRVRCTLRSVYLNPIRPLPFLLFLHSPPSSPKKAPFEITPSVAKGRSPSPSPPRPWGSTSSLIPPSS
eukprot:Em0004g640a